MSKVRPAIRRNGGQTIVETIVIAPVLFFIVFGLLQLGQLALGIIITNYGASSAAHKMSRTSTPVPDAAMVNDYQNLLVAGLNNGTLNACTNTTGSDVTANVTSDIIIVADARISAFPIIGPLLSSLKPTALTQAVKWSLPAPCVPSDVPTVAFTGPPSYEFIVRGSALARRNYL